MSSAIKTPAFQAKAGNITNEDGSSIYSNGDWSLKNSTAVASVTIKDDGSVGIGTDSPITFGTYKILDIRGTSGGWLNMGTTGTSSFYMYTDGTNSAINTQTAGHLAFGTTNTERMRIDASGVVQIGPTIQSKPDSGTKCQISSSTEFCAATAQDYRAQVEVDSTKFYINSNLYYSGGWQVYDNTKAPSQIIMESLNNNSSITFYTCASNTASTIERMRINASGTKTFANGNIVILSTAISPGAGSFPVKWNSSTGVLTYDSSSRLVKDQIENIPYGLDSVLSLQPRKYFRTDDQKEEIGFIADEVQPIVPEVVPMVEKSIFTKDEEDTELIPGGVNYEKLTAVLCKAIQEQQAMIEELKAKVSALESK